ncbi:MAG: ferrous iron transport protein A [Clostridia bacterium]|nr:ferrous iron transport protein A [Clostridia bacterium]
MTLNDLDINQTGTVTKIVLEKKLKLRLESMGLKKGVSVTKLRSAPLGDPIEFFLLGTRIALRKNEAKKIHIEREMNTHANSTCRQS